MVCLIKRKVVRISNCHYIALPHEWVKANGIVKGAIIEVELDANNNLVLKQEEQQNEEIEEITQELGEPIATGA